MIDRKTIIERSPGLQAARISENEMVILGHDSDFYLGIDETGMAIWDQLDGAKSIGAIVDAITGLYDAETRVIEKDVLVFVEQLLNEGVLRAHD
jgi:hypothetical protein